MDPISILKKDFHRAIATTYLKLGHDSTVMRGCQLSFLSTPRTQVAHIFALINKIMYLMREINRGILMPKLQGQTSHLLQ